MIISRPSRVDQSVFLVALAPPQDVTTTKSGKSRFAASTVFSPSTTNTGASGLETSSSKLYSG